MMTIKHKYSGKGNWGNRGFSLIELMVVIAILGALGAAVGVAINSEDAKLRSFVFNLGSRFKLANFEAIKRGRDVYLDFDMDGDGDPRNDNGYTMWVDNNNDQDYDVWGVGMDVAHGAVPANGVCDDDEGADCDIATVVFPNRANPLVGNPGPEIYDTTATGGPAAGPAAAVIGDGISAGGNRFRFRPSGDCSAGSAYIYFPRGDVGAEEVASGPWAIIVNNVGRIRIREWQPVAGWPAD